MAQRNIEIVETKLTLPTILVEHEGRMLPIHSKYNPIAEAERFIDSLAGEIEKSDHLLFYGIGLGYHLKIAQERYPEKVFSVYEPIEQVSNQFIKLAHQTGVNLNDLAKNYTEPSIENIVPNIHDFSVYFAQRVLLVTLPIYEKLVPQEMQQFNEYYKTILKEKVGNKQVEKKYGERWIINMMMNTKHTFTTPNILMQEHNPFENKPIILAAAGPSLTDEIENLKYIKENGLAYIFAVGSANKALIKHDILPDAVLSYDPQGSNWRVFEEIMNRNIETIPLIFGTTVGYETIDYYPGPKAHVVISNDKLTPYLHDKEMVTVTDSTTISNVTFQILSKLNVSKIILVGQNFAYRDDQFYANGIKRYDTVTQQHTDGKLNALEEAQSFLVEAVTGEQVRTNVTFDSMRKEMEYLLRLYPQLTVINTTKGGAKIEGAPFVELSELIKIQLSECVNTNNWVQQLAVAEKALQQNKLLKLEKENQKFIKLLQEAQLGYQQLNEQAKLKNVQQLNRLLDKSSSFVDQLHNNLIYTLFIKPLADIHTEQIYSDISLVNKFKDLQMKVESIAKINLNYLSNLLSIYYEIVSILNLSVILPLKKQDTLKWINATSGVFSYKGKWEKQHFSRKEKHVKDVFLQFYGDCLATTNEDASISFKFKGKNLQILGFSSGSTPLKVSIKVNNKTVEAICKKGEFDSTYCIDPQILFSQEYADEAMHHVEIFIPKQNTKFHFLGIKVNNAGEAYHTNEVDSLENMQEGEKIRAIYNGSYNTLGKITFDTASTNNWIPINGSLKPAGYFYFIKVNDDLLVADRVVHVYITSDHVKNNLNQLVSLPHLQAVLLDGDGENNQWDNIFSNNKIKEALNIYYENNHVSTWTASSFDIPQTTMRGDFYHFGTNEKLGDNLLFTMATSWTGMSPGVGFRPVLKLT